MTALGVDLAGGTVRVVAIDDAGNVTARGQGTDAVATARAAASGEKAACLGVASADAAPPSQALAALGERVVACYSGAAAMTAEAWIGAARGARHAACLKIGDRVLAGILLDGRVWTGAHGHAGSAAWLALNPVERQDYRKYGSLAAEVSSRGIARRLSWRIQSGDHSSVLERAGDLDAITAMHVFEGARSGDGVSISVVRDTARYIGMAVANLAATLDPEVVVVTGAVASARDLLLEPVRQECARRLPPEMVNAVRVEFSTLGEDGVAIGAARIAATAGSA
jgi:glucokinase